MINGFLPISKQDMTDRGIEQLDFVYISGDAYVDHPSFGSAIICRLLEAHGYTVGIIAQPDFRDASSITILGEPRYGFLVSSGNMDSMVNHYTVSKKHRKTDAFSPGGKMGLRPDHAVIVYCNLIRQIYKKNPIIIGGLEASLRRLAHYDYWDDKVRRSILLDSGADIISYGMGEHSIIEIADALASGIDIKDITFIDGTVFKTRNEDDIYDAIKLPSYEDIRSSKEKYAKSFYLQDVNTDPFQAKRLYETYDGSMFVVQNPPAKPLTTQEMDDVYDLHYMRAYHPIYEKDGGIPALSEIKFSLTSNRGCYGSCNFCALNFHQGRIIQTRSHESIVNEAIECTHDPDFKGYIHDVGGPTADFRAPACSKQTTHGACKNKMCLFPEPCSNIKADHSDYIALLKKLRNLPKVKKVFVRSGIRYDYVLRDKDGSSFLKELSEHHVSGQLRVAPEHVSDNVLALMGKPKIEIYNKFSDEFYRINNKLGKKQFIVPYLMSSHPGSTLKDAIMLAEYVRDLGYMPEQVQDFYPTPGTVSTCMYYTGINPLTMKPVYVAKSPHEKAMQRALIQYRDPKNYDLVKEALLKEGRGDLIGFDKKCLIPPRRLEPHNRPHSRAKTGNNAKPAKPGNQAKQRRTVKSGTNNKTKNKNKRR